MMEFSEAFSRSGLMRTVDDMGRANAATDKATYLSTPELVRMIHMCAACCTRELAASDSSAEQRGCVEAWMAAMFHGGVDVGRLMERQPLPEELMHG